MSKFSQYLGDPPAIDGKSTIDSIVNHGHQDLVQAVAFNSYGDRCATGSVDGKIRVFNRHKDGKWRVCDSWSAHGGEILELQWLPPTVYPNLLASLGIEGRFKLWAENPSAAPGRRFGVNLTGHGGHHGGANTLSSRRDVGGGLSSLSSGDSKPTPAFDYRNPKSPIRSFSLKHNDDTRHTYLALLSVDGTLEVLENETPENITEFSRIDQFTVCPKPSRGEETSFRVRFDPNQDVCYTALRAGVPTDALGLVVAAMDSVKVYRTRDTVSASLGVATAAKEFYLAAEISPKDPVAGHRGLVRDVAWAPGNIRGYDIVATACQDGYVRVFGLSTPALQMQAQGMEGTRGWGVGEMRKHQEGRREEGGGGGTAAARALAGSAAQHGGGQDANLKSGIRAGLADQSRLSGTAGDRLRLGGQQQPGQVRHVVTEVARLDSHRTPVWRVGFDDDGQILGSVGDEAITMSAMSLPARTPSGGTACFEPPSNNRLNASERVLGSPGRRRLNIPNTRILSSLESYGFSTSSFLRSSEESVGSRQHHRLNPAAVEGALRDIYREQEAATNNEVIERETQPSVAGDNKSIKITKQELAKPEVEHIEDIGHRKTPSLNGSDAKEVIADISAVNTGLIISLANAALHRGKSNSSMLPRQRPRSTGPDNTGETPFPSLDLAPCGRALASSKAGLLSEEAPSNLSTQCLPHNDRKPSGPYPRQQSKKQSSILRLLRYILRRPIKAKKWVVRKFRAKRKGVSKRFKTKTKARKEKKKRILELPKVEQTIVAPVTGEEVESVIVPVTVLEKPATAPVTAIQVDAVKAELKQVEQIASDEHVSVAEKELTIKAVVEKKIGSDEGSVKEVEDITVEIHVVDASTCVA
ncbi:WD40-repeat-containing domain protein [Neurospora crassa]|nr:WD40-repeat-containing domain protein [Neurospora crassa]